MKILVTGGAGFIGSHLIERLLRDGHSVVCFDDFNNYYDPKIKYQNVANIKKLFQINASPNQQINFVKGDIRDEKKLAQLFKIYAFDQVVHLAARAGVRPSLIDPKLYMDVNVRGTLNLLEEARKQKVKRFIFGSSSSVYGNQSKVPFSESDPCDRPISPYAASKRAGELLCANYFHLYGLPSACLRFFTVYGPRQRPEMAIGMFCRKILKGEPITLFGDGKTSRDYTYVSDIVQGIIAAMKMPKLGFEIFNLGNSSPITLKALVDLIAKTAQQKLKINWAAMQPGDVERTYADLRKSKKLLKYKPAVSISQGIHSTISAILSK